MAASEYCIYLRKSRADLDAEAHGEGETLARHEKALLALAKRQRLNITEIYREVVTGETIAARPLMQRLLSEVEQGRWGGVLVMEVERLARGDTMDQGLVAQTFKYSDTKIVTPIKTYDPTNEFDEEYFEFGLFMSRREYKTINRRLQQGRLASVKEGKYVASIAPYGYERVKLKNTKGYTLIVVHEAAEVVKMIFDWYVYGVEDTQGKRERVGIQNIARRLNEMQVPPIRHDYWQKSTIRDIIINPVYAGKVRWGWRPCKKKMVDGKTQVERPRNYDEDCVIADGLHEAIISIETFELAQKYLMETPLPPVGYRKELKNPLAGLIICGKCGRKMVFRGRPSPEKKDYIICHARACDNVGAPYPYVEQRVLDTLKDWAGEYKLKWAAQSKQAPAEVGAIEKALAKNEKDLLVLKKQLDAVHDLLEQGVYTTEQFLERSRTIANRMTEKDAAKAALREELEGIIERETSRSAIIPKVESIIDTYDTLPTAAQKNAVLKEVIEKAIYTKTVHGAFRGASADDFDLTLFPRLPIQ